MSYLSDHPYLEPTGSAGVYIDVRNGQYVYVPTQQPVYPQHPQYPSYSGMPQPTPATFSNVPSMYFDDHQQTTLNAFNAPQSFAPNPVEDQQEIQAFYEQLAESERRRRIVRQVYQQIQARMDRQRQQLQREQQAQRQQNERRQPRLRRQQRQQRQQNAQLQATPRHSVPVSQVLQQEVDNYLRPVSPHQEELATPAPHIEEEQVHEQEDPIVTPDMCEQDFSVLFGNHGWGESASDTWDLGSGEW